MKVSVSLPEEDVAFLDTYASAHRIASRSAALHRAIGLLRAAELSSDYSAAFEEWADDPENRAWDATVADGLPHG
ncbi:MAG: antitoxin [Acidimicrobiia bacterium]|nr:antitoxin [Acidimicrobiia bacterium]